MKTFGIVSEKKNDILSFQISGYFDEAAQLPPIDECSMVKIDLGNVSGINSYGIRRWCQWVQAVPIKTKIILFECPIMFIKSFNSVFGFFTSNMVVTSFYVPFYSPDTDFRKDVLYRRDEQFGENWVKHPIVLGEDQKPLELDTANNYFKFLGVRQQ
ncbi:MAG: hypothetical protein H7061_14745 [Bdellovibrionaceae bacterium]|nr:hypothetical protein [Bdellovibrio sp.]